MGGGPRYEGVRVASGSSIEISFYYQGEKCRERIKAKPTPANLARVSAFRDGVIKDIQDGVFDYAITFPESKRADRLGLQKALTVKDHLASWLEEERPYIAASTYNDYRKIVNNQLIPAFGEIPLAGFRRADAIAWAKGKDASQKTIGNILSPLRIALDAAVDEELIDVNPLAGWKIRRKRRRGAEIKAKIDPFSRDEREAIIGALGGQNRNLAQFALWTGLRTSELVALDWGDIDWIRGVVVVSRGMTQHADEAEEPKTAAANREVKLLQPALDALKAQKAHTYLNGKEVFQNPRTGERWAGDQPIRKTMWKPALKRAGVRYRKPYTTRHTYASMMLMAREPVQWVAQQMGHTDWAFTARTYAKWIPDDAPEAGEKAERTYGETGNIVGSISHK